MFKKQLTFVNINIKDNHILMRLNSQLENNNSETSNLIFLKLYL